MAINLYDIPAPQKGAALLDFLNNAKPIRNLLVDDPKPESDELLRELINEVRALRQEVRECLRKDDPLYQKILKEIGRERF